ncbi:hypothetical protein [Actinacidiphila sp. ITFR-21]|uniref:hypothetical protein n=1 Tax=Actinacidiphila sp. ITFR-21 TaxID=3075199 RepID=UPI0028891A56|nr:hypothetical protein [Streptomyces sp. ITFR-21]WNI17013.1 hypothetical protein RLT57_16785 [Streptomyces sp. ITFR-21]
MDHNDGGPRRRRGGLLAGVGLAVLAAVTAGTVAACGPSSPGHTGAERADAATAAGTPEAPAPSATGPARDEPAAAGASAAARGGGHVTGGVHSGDLRYFLLPPPADADVTGDRAGSPLTADDIAATAPDDSAARGELRTYGFRAGAYRTYSTADGIFEVTVKLIRLGTPADAAAYYAAHSYEGAAIPLATDFPARAYDLASGSAESTDTVLAVSYQGDTQIILTVTGGGSRSRAQLPSLLAAQHRRLESGR